jgi:DHA1 family bicyclomycin/chloramphenicol resistance-like MFS transporter
VVTGVPARSARLQVARVARVARSPSTAALVLVTGVGPFGTDTYIAALPDLQRSLETSATVAQLTLTAFIVGLAAGQLLLGSISDATGRRGLLLTGAAVFAVLSGVCAVAPNGEILVAARLGQGIAVGAGVVVGRAVVTDTHHGPAAAAKFGTLASITFLGPILAPALGGLILTVGTWRAVFAVLTVVGVLMVIAVLVGVPETLPVHRRQALGLRETGARMADLARDWSFMKHVTVYCLSAAGFFTYIGGSAFVLQSAYQVSPSRYAVVFATNAAAMAVTAVAFRALVGRVGASRLRTLGLAASTVAAIGLLALALADPGATGPLAVPWILLCLVVAGTGFTVPATTTLAQEAGRRSAGTAASLQGGLGFFTGALLTPLTGVLGYTSLLPMALAMTVFYLSASTLMRLVAATRGPA